MEPVDQEKYRKSLGKLESIFRSISATATEVSSWRCPYKHVEDRCTAKFGCRNQDRPGTSGELYLCLGSDDIDYRSAWETSN